MVYVVDVARSIDCPKGVRVAGVTELAEDRRCRVQRAEVGSGTAADGFRSAEPHGLKRVADLMFDKLLIAEAA